MSDTGASAAVAADCYSDECCIRVQPSLRTDDRAHGGGFIHSDVQTDERLGPTEASVGDQGPRILIDDYGDRFNLWQGGRHLDRHEGAVFRLYGCFEANGGALYGIGAAVQRGQHVAHRLGGKSRLWPAGGKRMPGPEPGATSKDRTGRDCTFKESSALGV